MNMTITFTDECQKKQLVSLIKFYGEAHLINADFSPLTIIVTDEMIDYLVSEDNLPKNVKVRNCPLSVSDLPSNSAYCTVDSVKKIVVRMTTKNTFTAYNNRRYTPVKYVGCLARFVKLCKLFNLAVYSEDAVICY